MKRKKTLIYLRLIIRNPYSLFGFVFAIVSIVLNLEIYVNNFYIFNFLADWDQGLLSQLNQLISQGAILALLGTVFGWSSYSYYRRIEEVYFKKGMKGVESFDAEAPCAKVALRMFKEDIEK